MEKVVQVGSALPGDLKAKLVNFLIDHNDVFAWSHHDMVGIDPFIIVHLFKMDPYTKLVAQKRRKFNEKRYVVINKEVKKLLEARVVRESYYPRWVANMVLVRKANKK